MTSADMEAPQAAPMNYYYLWHLTALGVIDADYGSPPIVPPSENETAARPVPDPEIGGSVWDTIAAAGLIHPARVALIDVGIAPDHPNLATRLDREASIDLTSHRYGSRVAEILDATTSFDREEKQAFFGGLISRRWEISAYPTTIANISTTLSRNMRPRRASCDGCSTRSRFLPPMAPAVPA
jgi:hypothetical protein